MFLELLSLLSFVAESVQVCDVESIAYPYHGRRTTDISSSREITVGSTLTFTCDRGYVFPDGNKYSDVTCIEEFGSVFKWSVNKVPDCILQCMGKCQNGGVCNLYAYMSKCDCPDGFIGDYCEREVPVKHGCQNLYDKDTSILDLHTKRAQVDPDKRYYDRGDRVTLKCEKNYRLEFGNDDAYRVYCHGFTDQTAEWTTLSWPGCAPITCKKPYEFNGHIGNLKTTLGVLGVGSKLAFQCFENYYIWGNSVATCLAKGNRGVWDKIPKCISLTDFKYRCNRRGMDVDFEGFKRSEAYCKSKDQKEVLAQKQLKTITVVTSTAAAIFGILLLVVAIIAFQRRRLLVRIRRLQESDEISEISNNIDHDIHIQHFLPSYAEAVQSKPTDQPPSFDEATQGAAQAGSSLLNEQGNEPGQSSQTMSSINPQAVETALSNDTSPPSYELGATATALSHDDDQIGFYENGVFVDDVESLIL